MSVTQQLAAEIHGTGLNDIPAGAIDRMARLFVDHVGISYMGYRETGAELAAYATGIGGAEEAVLLGTAKRVSCEVAAAVNAQLARNTDFEDTGPGLHPGPVIVHTALAVGQRCGSSGRELLAAMAMGHELNCRFFFGSIVGPDIRHANMVAAVIAARLLALDAEGIERALSLAWEFPIKTINYTKPKTPKRITALGMGNIFSARTGVQAALMALHGFRSVKDEIDQLDDLYNLDALVDRSRAFHHTEHSVFLKPWPTSHVVMQAIDELVEAHQLEPEDIVEIRTGLPDVYLMPHQNDAAPETYWEAIYSTAWAAAMIIHRVPPGPEWFTLEKIADPRCRATAAKIHIVEHPPATEAFQRLDLPTVEGWVEIETHNEVLKAQKTMAQTYGSPTRPMPDSMFDDKFLRLVGPSIGDQAAAQLLDALREVKDLPDLRELQPLLSAGLNQ